jgi:hypothetical protein
LGVRRALVVGIADFMTTPAVSTAESDSVVEEYVGQGNRPPIPSADEALWSRPAPRVDLLLTLGSPLGIPSVVFERLLPAPVHARGRRPPGVTHWINFADPGDIVAIPRWLGNRFDGIDRDAEPSIHLIDFHRVTSYLRHPTTAAALTPYLGDRSR